MRARSRPTLQANERPSPLLPRRKKGARRGRAHGPPGRAITTGGRPPRNSTVRAQQKSPALHRSSAHLVSLAVHRDPLSPHLILFNGRRVAVGRDVLADGDDLFRGSPTDHARGRGERHRPHLVIAPHRDRGVRVLELGVRDRTSDGYRFARIVTAPPVMPQGGTRQQCESAKEDDASHHRSLQKTWHCQPKRVIVPSLSGKWLWRGHQLFEIGYLTTPETQHGLCNGRVMRFLR